MPEEKEWDDKERLLAICDIASRIVQNRQLGAPLIAHPADIEAIISIATMPSEFLQSCAWAINKVRYGE
jgi:hypothetical protein